MKTEGWCVKIT